MSKLDKLPDEYDIGDIGEFPLIDRIDSQFQVNEQIELGIGDDAAIAKITGNCVLSTDLLVEGVHFRKDWSSPKDIGRKSVAVNVADIEAMGARPVAILIGFAAPKSLPVNWVDEFEAGVAIEAELAGVSLAGGDTTAAPVIMISVSVIGDSDGIAPVTRSGAKPGQVVAMIGRAGWASGGLAVLSRGFKSPRELVAAQQVPKIPYGQGRVAAKAGASALIDVSDGLLADIGHIANKSGVAIDIDSSTLEICEPLQRFSAACGTDALSIVLSGGEDHALIGCFDNQQQIPQGWNVIGKVASGQGVTVDGAPWQGNTGWAHFSQ